VLQNYLWTLHSWRHNIVKLKKYSLCNTSNFKNRYTDIMDRYYCYLYSNKIIILPKVFYVYIRRVTYRIIYALNRAFGGGRICFFNIKYQYLRISYNSNFSTIIILLKFDRLDIRSKCIISTFISIFNHYETRSAILEILSHFKFGINII